MEHTTTIGVWWLDAVTIRQTSIFPNLLLPHCTCNHARNQPWCPPTATHTNTWQTSPCTHSALAQLDTNVNTSVWQTSPFCTHSETAQQRSLAMRRARKIVVKFMAMRSSSCTMEVQFLFATAAARQRRTSTSLCCWTFLGLFAVIVRSVIVTKALLTLLGIPHKVETRHQPAEENGCAENPEQSSKCCQTNLRDDMHQNCRGTHSVNKELSLADHLEISTSSEDESCPETNQSSTVSRTLTLQHSQRVNQQSGQLSSQRPCHKISFPDHKHSLSPDASHTAKLPDQFKLMKDPSSRSPATALAKKNQPRKTRHGKKRIHPRFFRDCLRLSKALLTQKPAQRKQKQKSEVRDIGNGPDDDTAVLKELLFSPTVRFSPSVRGEVYMCEGPRGHCAPRTRGLHEESARLASFSLYEHVPQSGVWVTRLAAAGFHCADKDSSAVRCAFCDISVDISSFVNRNPMQLHRDRSPNCPLVTGAANNTSLQELGQKSGHHFNELLFGAATEQHKHHLPRGHEHEQRPSSSAVSASDSHRRTIEPARLPAHPLETTRSQAPELASPMLPAEPITSQGPEPRLPPQPSQPIRTQTTGNALPYQTARLVSPHQQEIASNPRPTETPGRNASSQSGSNVNAAPATPRAGPAPQSPPSSTADPPRQLVTYSQLGIYTQEPKRPDLAIATSRMNTYTGWPHATTHTPEEMAEAGFYYVGQNDLVRCFYCKGGLKSWSVPLRPWVEHARFYPQCPFVGQVKGQEFVDVVQDLKAKQDTIPESDVEAELKKRQGPTPSNNNNNNNHTTQAEATTDKVTDTSEELPQGAVGGTVGGPSGAGGVANDGDDSCESGKTADELQEENEDIKSERICKICQVNEVSILFLPCGHLVSCAQCAPALRRCAICRQPVKGRVRVIDDND